MTRSFPAQEVSLAAAAPMLDALAAGFRECKLKPIVGPKLQLNGFLDGMLRRYAHKFHSQNLQIATAYNPKCDISRHPSPHAGHAKSKNMLMSSWC